MTTDKLDYGMCDHPLHSTCKCKHVVKGKSKMDERSLYTIKIDFGGDFKMPSRRNATIYKRLATKVNDYLKANLDKIVADCM